MNLTAMPYHNTLVLFSFVKLIFEAPNKTHAMKNTVLISILLFSFIGCSSDDGDAVSRVENVIPTDFTADMLYDYPDAEGLLTASQTILVQTVLGIRERSQSSGLALATFHESPGALSYVRAGTVMLNDRELSLQDKRVYAFEPSFSNMSGIDFESGRAEWSVSGSEDVESFSYTFEGFPAELEFESNVNDIDLSSNYTLEVSGVSDADSLLFIIAADGDFVIKRTDAAQSSVTFTAADFAPIRNSDKGLVQVTAFNLKPEQINSRKMYFVNAVNVNSLINFK